MSLSVSTMSSTKFSTILLFILLLTFLFHTLATGSSSTTFTIVNSCNITVYPGIFYAAGTSSTTTGFSLHSGKSKVLTMPHSCSGNLWGRTNCFNNSKGMFHCRTGDCASSTMECNGRDASQPATLAKFNLNVKSNRVDYFSVTVEKGYNLPMKVQPRVGKDIGDCMTTSCMVHLNKTCPLELKVMSERQCIGCKSPCQPLSKNCYSELTKACPQNATSVCASTDYLIEFCPTSTRCV
ncbi:hypothetical protein TSUD_234290 [Trifolium subterraneum]|uniref:Uncharacterized protein n=1 Tax=Trifolium subterraneum TaxID=3900 RepID=A0A2Z6PSN5_TRISU|nr:hypothetical protein TSUD_234290 [Trifolium subterraneum]